MLASFLLSKNEFKEKTKQFFNHTKTSNNVEDARVQKIELNKKAKKKEATIEDKIKAKEAIRMHSHILKVNKEKEKATRSNAELKSYKNNFWRTAKSVTRHLEKNVQHPHLKRAQQIIGIKSVMKMHQK